MSDYRLSHGKHDDPADGRCAMEWVAYLAGEPHTDQPVCVSPILRTYGIALNDAWDDEQRQKLRPYLARCIGTAGDGRDKERAWLCVDWLIREYAPAWLDLVPSLQQYAVALRDLEPVLGPRAIDQAQVAVVAARNAARDAARDAAGDAARDTARNAAVVAARNAAVVAARNAAWYAARDAAGDAARNAAVDAARDAAWYAAWYAAWNAARDAARDALAPTVKSLQDSALGLFDRMLPTVPLIVPVADDAALVCGLER
jgi:hypothetical protein